MPTDPCHGMSETSRADRVRLMIDVDLFLFYVRRLLRVCELVHRSRLPVLDLRRPIRVFENQTVGCHPTPRRLGASGRRSRQRAGRHRLRARPRRGENVTCDGAAFDTAALLESARTLHRAIRSTADPIYCPRPGREGGTELRLRLGPAPMESGIPAVHPACAHRADRDVPRSKL